MVTISETTAQMLREYAERYETSDFIVGDPSWWMHQVEGDANREAMAFVASCLSYGSREQFMPKIGRLLEWAEGDMDGWLRSGAYREHFKEDDCSCFYRLYMKGCMRTFFDAYNALLSEYGTLGEYVERKSYDAYNCWSVSNSPSKLEGVPAGRGRVSQEGEGVCSAGQGRVLLAIEAISGFFAGHGVSTVVPKDTTSACKRLCMFLRWMVRDGSPVDLGLWSHFIDRRSLIMPLDTHVLHQAHRIGLITSMSASMSAAKKLTATLSLIFPDDPLKGDFALFGYGINTK